MFKKASPVIKPIIIDFIKQSVIDVIKSSKGKKAEGILIDMVKQRVRSKYGDDVADLACDIIKSEILKELQKK